MLFVSFSYLQVLELIEIAELADVLVVEAERGHFGPPQSVYLIQLGGHGAGKYLAACGHWSRNKV